MVCPNWSSSDAAGATAASVIDRIPGWQYALLVRAFRDGVEVLGDLLGAVRHGSSSLMRFRTPASDHAVTPDYVVEVRVLAPQLPAFSAGRPGDHGPTVVALILWLTLGPRAAAAEVFVELSLGLLLYATTHAGAKPVWRFTR